MQKNVFYPLGISAYKHAVSANPVLIQAADFNWRMENPLDKALCLEFSDPGMDQRFSAAWLQLGWPRLNTQAIKTTQNLHEIKRACFLSHQRMNKNTASKM